MSKTYTAHKLVHIMAECACGNCTIRVSDAEKDKTEMLHSGELSSKKYAVPKVYASHCEVTTVKTSHPDYQMVEQ